MAARLQKGKSRDKTSIFTGKGARHEACMGGFCAETLLSWKKKRKRAKKKAFGVGYGVSEQTDSGLLLIPQPQRGKGGGGKRGTTCVTCDTALPWTPQGWGRGAEITAGSCSIWAQGRRLALCSESWQGEQGHKGGSHRGMTFPLDSAGAGGGDLCRVSGGGCSQHCSRLFCPIPFALQAFSSTRVWVSKRYQPCMVSPALLSIQILLWQPDFQKSRFLAGWRWHNLGARPVSPRPCTSPSSPGCPARDIPSF